MIFKIHKPLYSNKDKSYLIHNEDGSVITYSLKLGQIPEIDKLFDKEEQNIYVKGYISKNGRDLVINRKVTGQDW